MKTHSRFKITSYDSPKWFWVRVYEDISLMQSDAVKMDRSRGAKIEDVHHANTAGVCVPYERINIYPDGKKEPYDNIGTVFLVKKYLSTTVVSHEILHAALWNYRLEHDGVADFGDQCGEREEELAHLYGQLFYCCVKKLYKTGLW